MREAVPGTASAAEDSGVFSIGQHMENNVVSPTAADVSKIHQDMNALQVRFNKITSADFRSKSSKPWKPEVTPPRRRGGFNRGRGGRQFDNVQRNDRFKNNENNGNQDGDTSRRSNSTLSEKGDQECPGHDFLMSRSAVSSKARLRNYCVFIFRFFFLSNFVLTTLFLFEILVIASLGGAARRT